MAKLANGVMRPYLKSKIGQRADLATCDKSSKEFAFWFTMSSPNIAFAFKSQIHHLAYELFPSVHYSDPGALAQSSIKNDVLQ
jgi:hypothetical protein